MVGRLHRLAFLLAATALVVPLVPTAAAETVEDTVCIGGETQDHITKVGTTTVTSRVNADLPAEADLYVDRHAKLWQESNDVDGLQTTARVCYDRVIVDGVVVSSTKWTDYPADTHVTG